MARFECSCPSNLRQPGSVARSIGRSPQESWAVVTTYFDSSVLVATYVNERFSARARHEIAAMVTIPYTPLHELEVFNALRTLHGRGILDAKELRGVLEQLAEDKQAHRLEDVRPDLFVAFGEAVRLSTAHATKLLCRCLDLLHVAIALNLGCSRFVSGDARQLALARAEGLEAVDIKARRTRRHRPR